MASWEDELTIILGELGVKQEDTSTLLHEACEPSYSNIVEQKYLKDHLCDEDDNNNDNWIDEPDTLRSQIDSIVKQVVLLMQHGTLDKSLKEDVMVVLRALRHSAPVTPQFINSEEEYLESASAMLHFCRLILQLSEFATEDF